MTAINKPHTALGMEPVNYLAHVLRLDESRIRNYFYWMNDFNRKVESGVDVRAARGDKWPDHTHAGMYTGIIGDGQMRIREHLRLWANLNGKVLYKVYDQLLAENQEIVQ